MREDGKIDYIEWPATDLPATKGFYQQAFGWAFTDYGPDYAAFEGQGADGGQRAEDEGAAAGEGGFDHGRLRAPAGPGREA